MSLKSVASGLSAKAKILIVSAAVVVAAAVVTAVILLSGGSDTYRVLKVFELNGSAVISREGAGELDAYVGMNLENGDTLTVKDGSTMRISMDNDKYVLLDGGTVLELVAEGTQADSRTSIKLKKGAILNELTSSLSANSSYEVSTPKSTMAVRGTSFFVEVVEDAEGNYTITVKTFHGKVEATLLDSEGRPTGKKVLITEDNSVIIRTVVNDNTKKPAEEDGISFFVFETEDNVYVEVPDGESPVSDIDYKKIIQLIRDRLLKSNDTGVLVLDADIVGKLRGYTDDDEDVSPAASQTSAAAPESEATTTTLLTEIITEPVTEPTTITTTTTAVPTETTTVATTVPTETTKATTVPAKTTAATTTVPVTTTTKATTTPEETTTSEETTATTTTPEETTTTTTPPTTTIPPATTTPPYTTTPPHTTTPPYTTPVPPQPEKFTVNFICDGVTVYSEMVAYGSTVSYIPDVPEKTGHTGKWVYSGVDFTSSTVITANTNVEAKYAAITYNVTFTTDDGTIVGSTTADYGTTVPASKIPAVPDKAGFIDGKWMFEGAEFTASTVIKGNTVVVAEYTALYTVTFVLKCTDTDETKELVKLENVPDGSVPDKVALNVVEETASNKYYLLGFEQPAQPITEDTTIYVYYELYSKIYQVKITDAEKTLSQTVAKIGSEITLPTADKVAPLDNYTFVGWGYVTSGSYSDPSVKEGAPVSSDTVDDYMLNVSEDYAPGDKVTLSDGNRLNGGYVEGYDNYRFFAVYKGDDKTITFVNESGVKLREDLILPYGSEFGKYEYEDLLPAQTGYNVVWTYNDVELTEYYTEVVGDMTIVGKYVAVP